jgi:ferredoxin-NADP reductase
LGRLDLIAPRAPGKWQFATVESVTIETPRTKTFRLALPMWMPHLAGQHYIVRLTAPDGYRAQRSYSVASAPGGDRIALTVQLLPGGEVSGFLHEVVEVGDELEVRGPIGGYFAWDAHTPALCVGGGSGVVPLVSMLRTARRAGHPELVSLWVSVRSAPDLFYAEEMSGPDVSVAYTRAAPPDSARTVGRLQAGELAEAAAGRPLVFVCGSPPFCDAVTALLHTSGVEPGRVRVERFGPTG